MTLPKVEGPAREVLRTLYFHKVLRGSELMNLAHLESPEKLVEAVKPLIEYGFIAASGSSTNPGEIPFAHFNFTPSSEPLVRFMLRQS